MIFTTREAVQGDIETLVQLRALLIDNNPAGYGATDPRSQAGWKNAFREWFGERVEDTKMVVLLVENDAGKAIGTVTGVVDFRPPTPDCINGLSGWVQSLVVDPSWRRRDVSTILMHALLDWFIKKHVKRVVLQSTQAAQKLYENLGFYESDEKTYMRTI